MYYRTTPYRIFNAINTLVMVLIALLCVVPMIHVLAVSLSGRTAADANLVNLWPKDFTLEAYKKAIDNSNFLRSVVVSVERTVLGTLLTLAVTFLAAYPLSKEDSVFRSRRFYSWAFLFTLIFNGGLVPFYIVILRIGLMNTFWVLVLPTAVNVYLIILLMNFFRGVPKELEEAALIDGASHFRTLISIYLPLSLPAIATIALFSMVSQWNSWFDGLLYINDAKNYPLSTFLQTVIIQQDFSKMNIDPTELALISQKTVKSAEIFIGALPILMVYPFLQRYFVKGLVLGSIKE